MSQVTHTAEVEESADLMSQLPAFLHPDVTLMILTWVTFFALLAVLQKFAWKPILAALDQRERTIRQSVEDADKIKNELANLDAKRAEMLAQAEGRAKAIIEEARKGASEAADIVRDRARQEAQILLENARRDIKEETQKAKAVLKEESARLAVDLAGRLIEKNLDDEENRRIVIDYVKKI